ncbi:MAG: hypothetical protein IT210_19830, partial [Armatimonadetes bacterium]|nr:hypothetical protein [Armatimonadota bacterium]
MLKINLLPGYIAERKRVKMAWVVSGAVLALVLAGLIGFWFKLGADTKAMEAKLQQATEDWNKVYAIQQNADTEMSKVGPINEKVTFVDNAYKHNRRWPQVINEVIKYTYRKVRYSSLTPATNTLTMAAWTDSVDSAARYLMNMMRNTAVWNSVTISGVPGDVRQIVNGEMIEDTLGLSSITSPATTTPSGPMGGAGMPGGGMGGAMMGGKGPGMMGGGMMGGAGGSPMMGGKGPGMMGAGGGMGGMMGGGTGAAGGGGAQVTPGQKGFNFTVTCTLVDPLTPPSPPSMTGGAATQAAGGPGGGMMGGGMMGGGMPGGGGMMGGGMPGGGGMMGKGPGMMGAGGAGMPGGAGGGM